MKKIILLAVTFIFASFTSVAMAKGGKQFPPIVDDGLSTSTSTLDDKGGKQFPPADELGSETETSDLMKWLASIFE